MTPGRATRRALAALIVVGAALWLAMGVWATAARGRAASELLSAAARGDGATLSALAGQGADVNAKDADGRPALLLAARSGRPEAVQALLRAGAEPGASDRAGWTPLHEAAEQGSVEAARALLDAGAPPDSRSRARGTPLDVAERGRHAEVAAVLRTGGARGSGKSTGDTVCVRPWGGEGYCGVVEEVDATRHRLRVTSLVGCASGCAPDPVCSAGQAVGGASGLMAGDEIWVPSSCLTHTGVAAPP